MLQISVIGFQAFSLFRAGAFFAVFALCLTILLPVGQMCSFEKSASYKNLQGENVRDLKVFASPTVSTAVVISQVYGGAGCGTAGCSTYQNDYIELYNLSNAAATIPGGSVQYAAATGTAWQVTALPANLTIQPGHYYLIAESFGANGVNPLPTPDTTGTIAMSATAAKVALVNSTTALSGACPTSTTIADFIGYGTTANCSEPTTTPSTTNNAPAPSTTTADFRNAMGLQDTDQNSADFTTAAPNPRNSALTPTAAPVSIRGKVLSRGRGVANAQVILISKSGASRTVLTNGFGNFTINNVESGATYVVNVSAKKYTFAPQVISVTSDISGLIFPAQ